MLYKYKNNFNTKSLVFRWTAPIWNQISDHLKETAIVFAVGFSSCCDLSILLIFLLRLMSLLSVFFVMFSDVFKEAS